MSRFGEKKKQVQYFIEKWNKKNILFINVMYFMSFLSSC